jgi:hypothetical protein
VHCLKHSGLFRKKLSATSSYLNRLETQIKIRDIYNENLYLLNIYENIKGEISDGELDAFLLKHPELDLKKMDDECDKKYPLLQHISSYHFNNAIDDIAHYINLADKI